ncbi:MAG: mechanosensitive ion channel, partial [Candidatus Margulisbacteria bacterium]|nr:mechanosensitive ion channel [Candidatus Margulisiibacteriota bacterium]
MDKIEKIFVLMFSPEKIVHYSAKAIGIILSLAVIYIFYKLVQFGIERAVRTRLHDGRFSMVASLVKSALRYVVFFIMLITVLQQLGLNITALLASAGILGLAISFGAQNLVRDIIS